MNRMGKKGIDIYHGKYAFICRDLWKKYKAVTGDELEYKEFQAIIANSIEEIKKWVLKEPIGFQLHPKFGNIAVNRFRMKDGDKVYINTPIGPIINHNLHTGGNIFNIKWFHSHRGHMFKQDYWFFKSGRAFNRALAAVLKSGKAPNYNCYMQSHFRIKATKTPNYG